MKKFFKKIFDEIYTAFWTIPVFIEECRRGGIDGTDTWTGGEHE